MYTTNNISKNIISEVLCQVREMKKYEINIDIMYLMKLTNTLLFSFSNRVHEN